MSSRSAVIFLAEGFEEVEAVSIIDVLRRGGVEVTLAGVASDSFVVGGHGIAVGVDAVAADVAGHEFDLVVLPGGMPGAENLAACGAVLDAVRGQVEAGRLVAAICAAPLVLAAAGVVSGKRVTCYPGFERRLGDVVCTGARVERDGLIVTGAGPGAALEFGLALLDALGEGVAAARLRDGMLIH